MDGRSSWARSSWAHSSWARAVLDLADFPLRRSYVRERLQALSIEDACSDIDSLCQASDAGDEGSREVLTALLPLLFEPDRLEWMTQLRSAAQSHGHVAAARLLRASTEQGFHQPATSNKSSAVMERNGRALTLGERRALARGATRSVLNRLLADPHPMVARLLLANPRITERDVLSMAVVRPLLTPIALEIAQAWIRSARVRMALALNRTTPNAVVVPILALLFRQELVEVRNAADLDPVVRSTAIELLELRPPMADIEPPALKH